tara:strand:- start:491 stop:2251 length:1761 start_codon:yes stop_codon:yes gene_type:complete
MTSAALAAASLAKDRLSIRAFMRTSKRFADAEKVGEGSYGIVFKCMDSKSGSVVAVKTFKLALDETGINQSIVREVNCQRGIRDVRFACMSELLVQNDMFMMITEWMHRSLGADIKQRGPYTETRALKVLAQIEHGIAYLHCAGIVHRDLKADNCITDESGRVKIIDMGTARCLIPGRTYTPDCTTMWYRSPEMLMGSVTYDKATDDWCIGCILLHMLEGTPSFQGDNNWEVWLAILQRMGTPDLAEWHALTQFLPALLAYDAIPKFPTPGPSSTQRIPASALKWMELHPVKRRHAANAANVASVANAASTDPPPKRGGGEGRVVSWSQFQDDITDDMRGIVVDWLMEVCHKMKITGEVLQVCVDLFDHRVGRKPALKRCKLQLVGVACLMHACKLSDCILVEDMLHICDNAYTSAEMQAMERDIFEKSPYMNVSSTYEAQVQLCAVSGDVLKAALSLCWLVLTRYAPPFESITTAMTTIRMAEMYFGAAIHKEEGRGGSDTKLSQKEEECLVWMHAMFEGAQSGWKRSFSTLWSGKNVTLSTRKRGEIGVVACIGVRSTKRQRCRRSVSQRLNASARVVDNSSSL